jgi:hypothetical protein
MRKLILILTVAVVAGLPFRTFAQDTTHAVSDTAAPSSNWHNYREGAGPRHYSYNTDQPSSFTHHLMVGGAISLGFYSGEFLIGANPYVGYALANWIDAGVAVNVQYLSENETATYGNGTYHSTLLGAGAFARVYPISFIFIQVQPEYNEIWQKEALFGQTTSSISYGETSFLVGGGVKFGPPDSKSWGFIAILFDVGGSTLSPYNGPGGNLLPIIRVGYNIGL